MGQSQIKMGLGFDLICISYIELIKKNLATLSAKMVWAAILYLNEETLHIGPACGHSLKFQNPVRIKRTSWGWSYAKLKFSLVEVDVGVKVGVEVGVEGKSILSSLV